jgi:hypothetical protein
METVSHVLYWCLSQEQELEPKEQLCYLWLLKFLEVNESAFVFDVPYPIQAQGGTMCMVGEL